MKESQPSSTHSDPGHVKTFAYVGRLVSEKGLSLLIHASKNLADQGYDFRLVFVGEGPEQPRLEELLTSLGLRNRAEFTGSLGIDAVRRATHTADAVVMPTLMEETAGLSAIEQMMRGGLAIVANVGGLGEMVGHAGLKFAPGDVEGLSSCLRRVLDEPDLPRIMGEQARERAIHVFSEDRMVADHRSLYHDLLTTQPPSTVNLNHGL